MMKNFRCELKICKGNAFVFQILLVQKSLRKLPKCRGDFFTFLSSVARTCSMSDEQMKDAMKSEQMDE